MDIRETIVGFGALVGYPFTCFRWIFASRRNRLCRGWHFFGISLGGFVGLALLICSYFTDDFVQLLLLLGGSALYLFMMVLFMLLANQCQQQIDRKDAERFSWNKATQPA